MKWAEGTRAYRGSKAIVAKLPDGVRETMERAAITAFQALGLRDYACVDFRLARDGKVYLLEANPNPYLHSTSEFIKGARASGRTYAQTNSGDRGAGPSAIRGAPGEVGRSSLSRP